MISIGGSQAVETCEATSTTLSLNEDRENQVRYTYRILWTVSLQLLASFDAMLTFVHRNPTHLGYEGKACSYSLMLTKYKATRWDNYLHIFDPRIHWLSLINSLAIVSFLCIMVAMILYRNVARDVCFSSAVFWIRDLCYSLRFPGTMLAT